MTAPTLTRRHAIRDAARIWRAGMDRMDRMSVTEAARTCYVPGGPPLHQLETAIRADRAARTARRAAA